MRSDPGYCATADATAGDDCPSARDDGRDCGRHAAAAAATSDAGFEATVVELAAADSRSLASLASRRAALRRARAASRREAAVERATPAASMRSVAATIPSYNGTRRGSSFARISTVR